jgi:hypothetical protein
VHWTWNPNCKKGDFTIKPAYDFDNKINDTTAEEESFFCGQCKKDFDSSRDYRAHQRIGCDSVTGSETPKKSVKSQDVTSSDDQQKDANKKLDLEPTLKESNNCSLLRKGQLKKFLRPVREKIVD